MQYKGQLIILVYTISKLQISGLKFTSVIIQPTEKNIHNEFEGETKICNQLWQNAETVQFNALKCLWLITSSLYGILSTRCYIIYFILFAEWE